MVHPVPMGNDVSNSIGYSIVFLLDITKAHFYALICQNKNDLNTLSNPFYS